MTDEKASCFFCTKLAVDKRGDFRRGTKSVTSRNMHGLGCCERDTWLPQLTWSMIGWWQSSFTSLIAGRLQGSLIKAQSAKPPTQPRVPSASTLHIHPERQISSIIHHTRDTLLLGDKHGGTAISRGAAVLLLNRSISVYINIKICDNMCVCFLADVEDVTLVVILSSGSLLRETHGDLDIMRKLSCYWSFQDCFSSGRFVPRAEVLYQGSFEVPSLAVLYHNSSFEKWPKS